MVNRSIADTRLLDARLRSQIIRQEVSFPAPGLVKLKVTSGKAIESMSAWRRRISHCRQPCSSIASSIRRHHSIDSICRNSDADLELAWYWQGRCSVESVHTLSANFGTRGKNIATWWSADQNGPGGVCWTSTCLGYNYISSLGYNQYPNSIPIT